MNGHVANALIMVIGVLLGLVQLLFSLVLKAHKDRDDERIADIQAEILRIRERLHAITPSVSRIEEWQRQHDDEKKH